MFLFPDRDKWQLPDSCGPLRSRPRPRAGREAGAADERARGGEQLPHPGDRDHQDREPEQREHEEQVVHPLVHPLRLEHAECEERSDNEAGTDLHRHKFCKNTKDVQEGE